MTGLVLGVLVLGNGLAAAPAGPAVPAAAHAIAREDGRSRLQLPKDLLIEDERNAVRSSWSQSAPPSSPSRSSRTARIVGVTIGAIGGFYAGGMLGYAIAQDDQDDDGVSGLPGVVIGAPIGAILGAWAGYQLTK
jgi:hypothetical protein